MPEALRHPNSVPRLSLRRVLRSAWTGAWLVAAVAALVLGYDLAAEPHFVDESAYYSQSYYARVFAQGLRDDASWLEFPAYDLPPLPKYLIGAALWLADTPTPGPREAGAWYLNTSLRFDPPGALAAARVPFVAVGVLGCVAIYGLGVLLGGRPVGLLAALLLMENPLYHTHARRAMSDVPCEAFMLLALLAALWAWRQFLAGRSIPAAWIVAMLAGVAAGLALLCKLSGMLALMVMASWVALAWAVAGSMIQRSPSGTGTGGTSESLSHNAGFREGEAPAEPSDAEALGSAQASPSPSGTDTKPGRAIGDSAQPMGTKFGYSLAMLIAAAIAGVVFTALNPYMTAHPRRAINPRSIKIQRLGLMGRARNMLELRLETARYQQNEFKHNALNTPYDKASTTFVQGFGRFGPLGPRVDDSTIRYDLRQDRGAIFWLPWVIASAVWAGWHGWEQVKRGQPPVAWAILDYFLVALTVVMVYLPLAWNRYFLSLQAPSALLAAGFAVALARRAWERVSRTGGH